MAWGKPRDNKRVRELCDFLDQRRHVPRRNELGNLASQQRNTHIGLAPPGYIKTPHPGVVFSAQLQQPLQDGRDPRVYVSEWGQYGYIKPNNDYWTQPLKTGFWYRFAVVRYLTGDSDRNIPNHFWAIAFRLLHQLGKEEEKPNIITSADFKTMKDMVRGEFSDGIVTNQTLKDDLWWLHQLQKIGRLPEKV